MNKEEILLQMLEENIQTLKRAKRVLSYSMQKCNSAITAQAVSEEELESCEALTARFARVVDVLTQKVFKSIFLFLKEDPLTFIDKCNLAEKFGIIDNANVLLRMRDLRNKIAHEYFLDDAVQMQLFRDVALLSVELCKVIDKVIAYAAGLVKKSE